MKHEDFEYTQLDDEEMTAFLVRQKQQSERDERKSESYLRSNVHFDLKAEWKNKDLFRIK